MYRRGSWQLAHDLFARAKRRPRTDTIRTATRTVTLTHQGHQRQYVLHVPDASNGALVLAFHGGGQRADQMRRISRFDALADRERFIVARVRKSSI